MKRKLLAIFGGVAMLLCLSPAARADSFMSIAVSGFTSLTCDNSTSGGVTTCTANGFTTTLHSNSIVTTSPTGISIGGYSISGVSLNGNSPGGALSSNILDQKFFVSDVSATSALVISVAQNNFALPLGSPLILSASQSGTGTNTVNGPAVQTFVGAADPLNSLTPGAGTPDTTPLCTLPTAGPGLTTSCSATGVPASLARSGPFAISGVESILMAQGDVASFEGTVAVSAPSSVPEPSSVLLLGTGMIILAGRRLRRNRKA